ncbi:transposase IS3/IS911 family protein, partial [mine drainage metagenome]
AVALLKSSGRPIVEVAKEIGVTDTTLGTWAREATKAATDGHMTDAEKEEAVRLRKRIRELETEIDILKRFTAYWVKEQGR